MVEAESISIPKTFILSRLGTDTSITSGRIKQVLYVLTSLLNKLMTSCKCIPHMSKIPTLTYNRANIVNIKYAIMTNSYI